MRSMVMTGVSTHSCTTVVRMAAPVGVVSSALIGRRSERHALEQRGRARSGNRHQAVGTFHHAAAGRHRPAGDALGAEQVEADGGAGDVGDAVEGADLVKMHLFQRHAMRGGFGLGQSAKDAQGQVALSIGQLAASEDRLRRRAGSDACAPPGASTRTYVAAKPPLRTFSISKRDRQAERIDARADGLRVHAERRSGRPASCRR